MLKSVDEIEAKLDAEGNNLSSRTLLYFIARIIIEWYRYECRRDYDEWNRRNG